MTVDYERIRKRIRETRRQRHMTQAELAEIIEISDTFVSRIETGSKKPSLTSIIKIVHALEISLDILVLDDSPDRLPEGYHEFLELLSDCDCLERAEILKTASAFKRFLRGETK